jgi:hypothetical protein
MHTDVLARDAVVQEYERPLATQNHLSKDLQQRENTSTEQLVANIVELKKERLCDGSGSIGVDVIGSKRSEAVPRLYGYSL